MGAAQLHENESRQEQGAENRNIRQKLVSRLNRIDLLDRGQDERRRGTPIQVVLAVVVHIVKTIWKVRRLIVGIPQFEKLRMWLEKEIRLAI